MDKKILKTSIRLAVIGFFAGMIISFLIYYLTEGISAGSIGALSEEVSILSLIAGGVFGAICMGTMVVYDIEKWSILKATFTHFALSMVGLFLLSIVQGWFWSGSVALLFTFIISIVVYFVIWMVMFIRYKREVRKMNEGLKNIKC